MKCKRLIPLFLVLPFCLGAQIIHTKVVSLKSTDVLYKILGDKSETLNFKLLSANREEYVTTFRLYNNKTNTLQFSSSTSRYVPEEGLDFSITYPLRYRINSDGLKFTFEVADSEQVLISSSGVLYPYVHNVINALTYKNSVYTTENCFIKLDAGGVVTGESFGFKDYNEYLSKTKNNAIDFSTVIMQYPHSYAFNYLDAEYHIKDYNNVYPNLYHEGDEVVIKMKCTKSNRVIYFSLAERMYVNNKTLEMSKTKLSNYKSTDTLFIPIGKERLLEENDSYILIKEAGYSAIDIVLPLSYYFSKNLIGLCYESDYCLVGGVRE